MKNRRIVIKALGAGLSVMLPGVTLAQADPRNARPQEGDRLVFADGDNKGTPIKLDALLLGGPPVTAMPQDAASGTVRDGSRLNQILLVRLDPARLQGDTQGRSAQGVVAYSAVCTHVDTGKADVQVPVPRFRVRSGGRGKDYGRAGHAASTGTAA